MKKRNARESGFKLRAGTYTAEQIINHAIEMIEEEPRRLVMANWVSAVCGRIYDTDIDKELLPECGTAACAGGWIGLSVGKRISSGGEALNVLGLPNGSFAMCGCSACCRERRSATSGAALDAAFALSRLFQRVKDGPEEIVPALKAIVEEHREVLRSTQVDVPSRRELRNAAR